MERDTAVRKEIILLILPIILENILQISTGIVSAAMIGRLSPVAVAGQGICLRLTDTLWCLYKGIGIGATVLIARAHGAGDRSKTSHIITQTFLSAIPLSLLFALILKTAPLPFLRFFTQSPPVLEEALRFLAVIVTGFPFVVIMQVVTAAFQGQGDTRTPMFIALLMSLCNLILGRVLIFGVLTLPAMGIRGAAISLVLSQAVGALSGLYLLYRRIYAAEILRRPTPKSPLLSRRTIGEIYHIGLPASLESMFWQFSAIVLSKIILSYGEISFAAYQLGIQAETITEMPAIGFGVAATTLTGKAIGKKDADLGQRYFRGLIRLSLCISIVTSLLLILLPGRFMSMMTDKEELQSIGIYYVCIMGFIQIPQNLSRIYNGAVRAAGYPRVPMYIAGVGIWGFRIPLAFCIAYVLHWNIVMIWFCIAADQIVRYLLSLSFYKMKGIMSPQGEKLI